MTANALHGMSLVRDETDRSTFFDLLIDELVRSEWSILAYSLMTTHYHLLLKLKKPTLSSGFQRFHSRYARAYNRRHKRRGVVWQRRFHDVYVDSDRHLFECVRYIALNAPRAQVCAAPEDWPWSSYGAAIGAHPTDLIVDEPELLAFFGSRPSTARRRLRAFVEERDPRVRLAQSRL